MSKTYGKKIYDALKENKIKSLSILLEQDEEETKNTDKPDSGSEDEENSEDTKNAEGDADDIAAALGGGSEGGSEGDPEDEKISAVLDDEALKNNITDAEKVLKNIAQNQEEPFSDIEDAAANALQRAAINANTNESFSVVKKYYKTNSIGSFINEVDDQKIKKMTNTMSGLEDQLKKYQDTVDSITKGIDIHMPTFVKEAIASLISFDSKFSKENIVFNIFRNKLATSSGKSAKENIEEFEKLFYKELSKIDRNISKEDVIIPAEKSHVAQGAIKQG